jgi:myosin-1
MRAPPPPPPPPAAAPANRDPTCRALYDFAGQSAGEMSVKKGDVVIVVRKEPNGMHYVLHKNVT